MTLLQQEVADKADLSVAPLHTVVQAVHGAWFYQTTKRFSRSKLLRRTLRGFYRLVFRYIRLKLRLVDHQD